MRGKPAGQSAMDEMQLPLDFDAVIRQAEVRTREEVSAQGHLGEAGAEYNPVLQTAEYMQRAVRLEEVWETTIQKARQELLSTDACDLYLDFFLDLKKEIEQGSSSAPRLAELLRAVGIRGFGMHRSQLHIVSPPRGGTRWRVHLDRDAVQEHLHSHIVGRCFLNRLAPDETVWKSNRPWIGASDVSQHYSAVPVPARFFRRSVPFVLNNAAGTLFRFEGDRPRYENLFDPSPNDALLRWMLIDPSYQDELEPEDYRRCLASAMDVGQYKFDLGYLLKSDRRPPIVLRDGSLFPQDAYLDNFIIANRRGEFTREAIREMLACLLLAQTLGSIYCGVSKSVQLKMYSAVVDWYIARYVDCDWDVGGYTLNDGQAMSILLSSPSFISNNLEQVITTCLIRRSFVTRAAINERKPPHENIESYFDRFETQHEEDITPYRELCKLAQVYMFFIGHSKSPQQQLPRYEFFYDARLGDPLKIARRILSAIRHCTLTPDHDHSFMADQPITYLLAMVTQQAHLLSKDVGKYIDRATGQWIMARYRSMVSRIR